MAKRLPYALIGLISTIVGMAAGHFVAALLNPAASPVLAVGSIVIDNTPASLKQWAIRNFESDGFGLGPIQFPAQNYDKVVLIGSVVIAVLVLAAIAGMLTQRSFRLGASMILGLVAIAAVLAMLRSGAEIIDLIPAIATAIVGFSALWWLDRTAHGVPLLAGPGASTPASSDTPAAKSRVILNSDSTDGVAGGASTPTTSQDAVAHDEGKANLVLDPDGDDHQDGSPGSALGSNRRGVLIGMGVLAVAATAFGTAGRAIGRYRSRIGNIVFPAAVEPIAPLPTGLEAKYPAITPFRVSNENFYRVDTRLDTPVVDIDGWTLKIDGDVENELEFTFDELLEMPLIERDITLTCVSNSVGGKYVGGTRWLGVRLTDLMEKAGVGSNSNQLLMTDFAGMTIGAPLDKALDGRDSMLVVAMNGEPLPREHGFPARMVIPGLYGFISATKWITKITATTYEAEQSYWTERDWATEAPIKISTRIDTPKALEQVSAGETVIGGVAWAQLNGGIAKVEVKIDGGGWQEAELGPDDGGNDYWRQWAYLWDAAPGMHNISARCIDGNGDVQTDVRAEPFPEGSSGIQTLIINVA